jgi:hypothetical protein
MIGTNVHPWWVGLCGLARASLCLDEMVRVAITGLAESIEHMTDRIRPFAKCDFRGVVRYRDWAIGTRRASFARRSSFLAVLALAVVPASAVASDQDAARIEAAGHSLKWNWTPPGRSDRYGHGETLIHAPLSVVRARVVDYAHYKDFMPDKFKSSRIVGHGADGSADVYIQILVLGGMVTLWDVTRFAPPKTVGPGVDVIEGQMLPGKGNVENVDVIWTLRALDADFTVLKLDVLLKPGLPVPQWAMDIELRDSATCAVDAIHDRAQGSKSIALWSSVASSSTGALSHIDE